MSKVSKLAGPVAQEVLRMLALSATTLESIAKEIGVTASAISAFKGGRTKLPIRLVAPLSKACGQDPAVLLRIVLAKYYPEVLEAFGHVPTLTVDADEFALLEPFNRAKRDVAAKKQREALLAAKKREREEGRQAGSSQTGHQPGSASSAF